VVDSSVAQRRNRPWTFDSEERSFLLAATVGLPELHAFVMRATPHVEIPELWFVRATPLELDEMYTLIEGLFGGTRSRKRHELLEGLLATLCTSIDGF
jgi:hypothetical protein